jgi:putative transcriptional regulator
MISFNDGHVYEPQRGRLLISEPFLPDPNFERTVILLCEHNEQGSFGFVLNKPSLLHMSDVLQEAGSYSEVLYVGGPVQQDTLHFIHRSSELDGGLQIAEGIYWGGNFEEVSLMLEQDLIKSEDFRFFLGYSGWGAGQLQGEIEQNSWIVSDKVTPEQVFNTDPEILWKEILKNMGGKYKMFSNYPLDPRLN